MTIDQLVSAASAKIAFQLHHCLKISGKQR